MEVEHPASLALHVGISEPGDVGAVGGRGVEETSTTDATEKASSASGLAVSVLAPASMTLSAGLLMERWIILPSPRYAIL